MDRTRTTLLLLLLAASSARAVPGHQTRAFHLFTINVALSRPPFLPLVMVLVAPTRVLSSFQTMTAKKHAVFLMEAENFPKLDDVKALLKGLKAADENGSALSETAGAWPTSARFDF